MLIGQPEAQRLGSKGESFKMGKLDETKVDHILSTLKNLEYGSVVITVHDGDITQIDATEKKRFSLTKDPSTSKSNNKK